MMVDVVLNRGRRIDLKIGRTAGVGWRKVLK
jgi:hypothetical protein